MSTTTPHTLIHNADGTEGIEIAGWKITTISRSPILKADELEEWSNKLNAKNLPEMVFGKNHVTMEHTNSSFKMSFLPYDALSTIIHDPQYIPKVSYAQEWLSSKQNTLESEKITEVYNYDWSFTPQDYKGVYTKEEGSLGTEVTTEKIDMEKLKRPDPILFFSDTRLYEDELSDNGVSLLSLKMRVMPTFFFALMRFWLRIDGVLYRTVDTRIFHEYDTNYVLREHSWKESSYKYIHQMLPADQNATLDANAIISMLKLRGIVTEKLTFQ